MKKFKIERTKSGLPARWEYGGACSNTGEVSIVSTENGQKKKAIYIKKSGHLANGNHALIIIEIGDFIIRSYQKRLDFWIQIYKIVSIEQEYAITELIYEFSNNQWNVEPPEFLTPAIEASKEKATCYHCRSPHFILE